MGCGLKMLVAGHMIDVADLGCREPIPPSRQFIESDRRVPGDVRGSGSCGGGKNSREAREYLFHNRGQFVYPWIGNAILASGEDTELPLKSKNIPWVNDRSASDA